LFPPELLKEYFIRGKRRWSFVHSRQTFHTTTSLLLRVFEQTRLIPAYRGIPKFLAGRLLTTANGSS
jgi:hypothetical protein